jgi:hypothetical protein
MKDAIEVKESQPPDEEPLEGGFIGQIEDLEFHEPKHRAETARRLAYLLVWILGVSVSIHYIATILLVLLGKSDATESLAKIFNVWLPVISSLVSAATTYYFTREKS